jgi:hypothetical protein
MLSAQQKSIFNVYIRLWSGWRTSCCRTCSASSSMSRRSDSTTFTATARYIYIYTHTHTHTHTYILCDFLYESAERFNDFALDCNASSFSLSLSHTQAPLLSLPLFSLSAPFSPFFLSGAILQLFRKFRYSYICSIAFLSLSLCCRVFLLIGD